MCLGLHHLDVYGISRVDLLSSPEDNYADEPIRFVCTEVSIRYEEVPDLGEIFLGLSKHGS